MDISAQRKKEIADYYLQEDVKEVMVQAAEGREVAPTYPYGYGSRPDAVNFPGDFTSMVDDGAVAFHGSVERWRNPLLIDDVDSDELRTGWDLVIDIDCDERLEFAKITAKALIDEIESFGVKNISVKFSGNRGFHIGVRGECFPERIQGRPLSDWYPELPQTIVSFLRDQLREELSRRFSERDPSVREIVYAESDPTPYRLVDIENDWGDRHLFRLPYSVNEKSWLVSLPLEKHEIDGFEKADAAIDKVSVDGGFLDSFEEGEAEKLAVEALDWTARQPGSDEEERFDAEFETPEDAIPREYFPPTIKNILSGLEDGRKRAVFILITFLQNLGYGFDAIETMLWEWNERNQEPLDENYIRTQLNWHRRQDEPLMPPNWDSRGFYTDMQVYEEDPLTESTSNPVSYALAKASDDADDDEESADTPQKPTMECPYCGKEYQGETKWYRDHVRECQG